MTIKVLRISPDICTKHTKSQKPNPIKEIHEIVKESNRYEETQYRYHEILHKQVHTMKIELRNI